MRKTLTRCETQLEAEEVAELTSLAEQPDFLNAQPEYVIKTVQDNPSYTTIIYRKEGREKKVRIDNYDETSAAEKAKLPPSLVKLLERVRGLP
jgi:hypothetical protein